MTMARLKLSQLDDDVTISCDREENVYTVKRLKHEIRELNKSIHKNDEWYVVSPAKWKPDAKEMLDNYIGIEYQDMYEGWDERALDSLDKGMIETIQGILENTFGSSVTDYWKYDFDKPVVIDVFQSKEYKG